MKKEKLIRFLFLQIVIVLLIAGCADEEEKFSSEQYIKMGLNRYVEKDYQGAIRFYDKAVEVNPNNPIAFHQRGLAKGLLNDLGGALSDLDRAIELDPNYAQAFFNRGLIRIKVRNAIEGCKDLETAGRLGYEKAYTEMKKYCQKVR